MTALDLGFRVPTTSPADDWRQLDGGRLFLAGRPWHSAPGRRVWLFQGDRRFHSYRIGDVVFSDHRHSTLDGRDMGPGWTAVITDGRPSSRTVSAIADPSRVGRGWRRGIRYLQPGGNAFVRVGPVPHQLRRAPYSTTLLAGGAEPRTFTQPASDRTAEPRERRLVEAYRRWHPHGDTLVGKAIPLPGGNLYADAYDPGRDLLLEAKASVRRADIRMAIGQLLDYAQFFTPAPQLAVLLPGRPADDIVALLDSLSIGTVWRTRSGFDERLPSRRSGTR